MDLSRRASTESSNPVQGTSSSSSSSSSSVARETPKAPTWRYAVRLEAGIYPCEVQSRCKVNDDEQWLVQLDSLFAPREDCYRLVKMDESMNQEMNRERDEDSEDEMEFVRFAQANERLQREVPYSSSGARGRKRGDKKSNDYWQCPYCSYLISTRKDIAMRHMNGRSNGLYACPDRERIEPDLSRPARRPLIYVPGK